METKNVYEIKDFSIGVPSQTLQFYKMNEDGTHENGTTFEIVLEVLIERANELNALFPCRENALAITKMQEAVMWFNARTVDRLKRGVEGQHKA